MNGPQTWSNVAEFDSLLLSLPGVLGGIILMVVSHKYVQGVFVNEGEGKDEGKCKGEGKGKGEAEGEE